VFKFEPPNGAVSDSEIVDAEHKLGYRLPEPFRHLIRDTGGGSLSDNLVIPGSAGSAILTRILGLEQLIYLQHQGFNEVVPHEYLVVGDGGGGALCLRIADGDEGSVWWADYDLAEELDAEEPTEKIMSRLADDFAAFARAVG
jgi:SMI1 / KNR4 family (SUKH-1)